MGNMFRGRLPLGLIVVLLLPAHAGAATPLCDGDIIFRPVISPGAQFASELLETVESE
jgi:hypothetical protein